MHSVPMWIVPEPANSEVDLTVIVASLQSIEASRYVSLPAVLRPTAMPNVSAASGATWTVQFPIEQNGFIGSSRWSIAKSTNRPPMALTHEP